MKIPILLTEATSPRLSYEVFPSRTPDDVPRLESTASEMEAVRPLFMAVTCGAGGSGAEGTLETTRSLGRHHALPIMPHLTCVSTGPDDLETRVAELRELGVKNVLVVRGDKPEVAGGSSGYAHASDLVRALARSAPDLAIGVAAYPDGHPDSPSIASDIDFLRFKFDQGASFGVTQLFFDNRRYFDMVERLAARGCRQPVIPAVLPVRSLAQIKRVTSLCDAPVPGRILGELERLHAAGDETGIREYCTDLAVNQVRDLLAQGAGCVHLYPFNRADICLEVARRCGLMQ